MRRTLVWLVLLAVLVACGGRDDALPTQVPLAEQSGDVDLASPRDAADTGSGLPPTWTPAPVVQPETTPETVEIAPEDPRLTYRVQEGDTLGEIAERFGVSLAALADMNQIVNIDVIEVDQELIIPES